MGSSRKIFSLLVIVAILVASSLTMIKPECALAQITTTPLPQVTPSSNPTSAPTPTPQIPTPTPTPVYPKPAIPQFTLKQINSLPEANKTTIELTITNQPFDKNNIYNYSLVYNVRIKTDDRKLD